MTRSTIRLIRFGSAKILTLASNDEGKPEVEEPSLRYI